MPDENATEDASANSSGEFEWDDLKNETNIEKHGIDFAKTLGVFSDPAAIRVPSSKNFHEQRYLTTGEIDGALITVVYTLRGDKVRIISARRAHKSERRRYGQ